MKSTTAAMKHVSEEPFESEIQEQKLWMQTFIRYPWIAVMIAAGIAIMCVSVACYAHVCYSYSKIVRRMRTSQENERRKHYMKSSVVTLRKNSLFFESPSSTCSAATSPCHCKDYCRSMNDIRAIDKIGTPSKNQSNNIYSCPHRVYEQL